MDARFQIDAGLMMVIFSWGFNIDDIRMLDGNFVSGAIREHEYFFAGKSAKSLQRKVQRVNVFLTATYDKDVLLIY
jgi:hypothetical protein